MKVYLVMSRQEPSCCGAGGSTVIGVYTNKEKAEKAELEARNAKWIYNVPLYEYVDLEEYEVVE